MCHITYRFFYTRTRARTKKKRTNTQNRDTGQNQPQDRTSCESSCVKVEGQGVAETLHHGKGGWLPQDINIKQKKQTTVVQVGLALRWEGYDSGLR